MDEQARTGASAMIRVEAGTPPLDELDWDELDHELATQLEAMTDLPASGGRTLADLRPRFVASRKRRVTQIVAGALTSLIAITGVALLIGSGDGGAINEVATADLRLPGEDQLNEVDAAGGSGKSDTRVLNALPSTEGVFGEITGEEPPLTLEELAAKAAADRAAAEAAARRAASDRAAAERAAAVVAAAEQAVAAQDAAEQDAAAQAAQAAAAQAAAAQAAAAQAAAEQAAAAQAAAEQAAAAQAAAEQAAAAQAAAEQAAADRLAGQARTADGEAAPLNAAGQVALPPPDLNTGETTLILMPTPSSDQGDFTDEQVEQGVTQSFEMVGGILTLWYNDEDVRFTASELRTEWEEDLRKDGPKRVELRLTEPRGNRYTVRAEIDHQLLVLETALRGER